MSLPRIHSHPNPYASTHYTRQDSSTYGYHGPGLRAGGVPRLLKRLFKFPQMDFEVAVWEMTNLMIAPRKVFRNMYYHKQTRNTQPTQSTTLSTSDPAFPYLLLAFILITSFAWSLAYSASPHIPNILRIACFFLFVQCLGGCLVIAAILYFAVPRLFDARKGVLRGVRWLRAAGGGRAKGLFGVHGPGGVGSGDTAGERADELEFGFCFDVHVRAFTPLFTNLYVLQFLLLPVLTTQTHHLSHLSAFLSNTLHMIALLHSFYITFLGYSSLPFLGGSDGSVHLLFAGPALVTLVWWIISSAVGWNASLHLAPVLWCAGGLRNTVGGGASNDGAG